MARGVEHPAGTITVKGATFEIFTSDLGEWLTRIGGDRVEADTRDGLKAKISRRMAAARITVAVPFLSIPRGGTIRRGTATGLHSSTRNVLIRWEDGETGQISSFSGDKFLADSDGNAAEWQQLREVYLAASKALYAFEKANEIDVRKQVTAAVEAAVSESGEQE